MRHRQHVNLVFNMGSRTSTGMTLLEILVAVGILGILLALGAIRLQAPETRLAANAFQALLQEKRMQAIQNNRAVAVVWDETSNSMIVRVATVSTAASCDTNVEEHSRLSMNDFPRVRTTTDMNGNGLIWLPNGRAQGCSGGSPESITRFAGDSNSHTVEVSAGGRVTVQ